MILGFSKVHKHDKIRWWCFHYTVNFVRDVVFSEIGFFTTCKEEIWNQNSHKAYLSTPTLLVETLFKRLTFGINKIHLFISSYSNISLWTNQFHVNKVFKYAIVIHRNLFVNVKYHHWHNFCSTISNLLGSNYNLAVYHAQTTLFERSTHA